MSLFGNTSSAPSFSFGQPATNTPASSSTATTSLFGSSAPSTTPGTSLFGGGAQAPPNSTPSLFGNSTATTAPKPTFSFGATPSTTSTSAPPTTNSLFGNSSTNTTTPATSTGGLFGSSTTTTTTAPTGGLFGNSTFGQNTTGGGGGGGGLFGSTAPTNTQPSFGASQSTNTNQLGTTAAGSPSNINKNTKFQDLPDQARNVVEELDKFIRQQGQLADELKGKNLGSEITQTGRMFDQYSAEATTVQSLLQTDARLLSTLRQDLEQSLSDLHKTTTLIEGFKGGPQGPKAQEAKNFSGFPFEYFRRKANELEDRTKRYKVTVDQISSLLNSPSASLSPSSIAPTLKAQHASLLSLASAVSSLDLELSRLKDEYRQIWKSKTGRMVDPFRLGVVGNAGGVKGVENGMRGVEIR